MDPVEVDPETRWRRTRDRWVWAGLAVPAALALWLTSKVWGGRPPGGDDVMGHLVRADYGLHHLVFHFRLDGWFPRFMVGHQEFLLYGPGFDWLIAIIRIGSFGLLSDVGAFKVVAIGAFVGLGPSVAYLARSVGVSRRGAVLAAGLAYVVNNPFGVGVAGTFGLGLVPEQVAAIPFCVAVGSCWRLATGSGERRHARIAVASMSALIITHPIGVMVTAAVLLIALLPPVAASEGKVTTIRRLVGPAAITAAITAWWLIPYLAHWNLRGPIATWDTPSLHRRFHDIMAGTFLFGHYVGAAVLAAAVIIVLLRVAGRAQPVVVALVPALFVVFADYAHRTKWPSGDVGLLLENRGIGLAALIAVVGLGHVLDGASDGLWRRAYAGPPRWRVEWTLVGDLVAIGAVVALVVVPIHGRRAATQQPVATSAMRGAAAALRVAVPSGARFAVERDFPGEIDRTGVTQPDLWLAYESGRNEMEVFNGESSYSGGAGYVSGSLIHTGTADQVADQLGALGVSVVVTTNPATAPKFVASDRFAALWAARGIALFGLHGSAAVPDPGALLSAPPEAALTGSLTAANPDHMRWRVNLQQPAVVTIAVGWSPKWHLRANGRTLPIRQATEFHLLSVALPAGQTSLAIDYRPDRWDWLGRGVSLGAIVGLAVSAVRRRRRTAGAPATSEPDLAMTGA